MIWPKKRTRIFTNFLKKSNGLLKSNFLFYSNKWLFLCFFMVWGVLSKEIKAFVTLNPELAQKNTEVLYLKYIYLKSKRNPEWIRPENYYNVQSNYLMEATQKKPILRRTSQAIRSFWVDLMELSKLAISWAAKSRNVKPYYLLFW